MQMRTSINTFTYKEKFVFINLHLNLIIQAKLHQNIDSIQEIFNRKFYFVLKILVLLLKIFNKVTFFLN